MNLYANGTVENYVSVTADLNHRIALQTHKYIPEYMRVSQKVTYFSSEHLYPKDIQFTDNII